MPGKHTDTFAPADYTYPDAYSTLGYDDPDTHLGYSFNDSKHRDRPAHRELGYWTQSIWISASIDW